MGWSPRHSTAELTLVPARVASDVLPEYRGTRVGDLLAYHNLGVPHRRHTRADLLVGMCMDYRLQLRIPTDFAFILRCAGANLGKLEFDVSFAIAVGGIGSICLIGHDECRMVDVASKREAFVSGLVENAGWDRHRAEAHFVKHASRLSIVDVVEFVWCEAERIRETYTGIVVAPLVYSLSDHRLCQITKARPSTATVHRAIEAEDGEARR